MDRSSRRMASRRPPYALSTSPPPSGRESPFGSRRSSLSPVLKSHSWHQSPHSQSHSQPQPYSQSQSQNGHQSHMQPPSQTQQHDAAHTPTHGHARRSSRAGSQHDISFTTPEANRDRDQPQRKRSRGGGDNFVESPPSAITPTNNSTTATTGVVTNTTPQNGDRDLDDGPTKGGHSLRRRARVNYATEQIEDEVTVPNSTRLKKRRSDGNGPAEDDEEDIYGSRLKKRRSSLSIGTDSTPSGRRRNPSRKSVDARAYTETPEHDEHSARPPQVEDEIRDTIQVGNYSSTSSSPSHPSSKSESKNGLANRSGTPDRDLVSHISASQVLPDTPSKSTNKSAIILQDSLAALDSELSQDASVDPSQQLQKESIESLQSEPQRAYYPSSSIINKPKPARTPTKTSPVTTFVEPQDPNPITTSPGPIKEELPMDEDTTMMDEPRPSTPLPSNPQLAHKEERDTTSAKDEAETVAQPTEETKSPPPRPSVEDGDQESAPSARGEQQTTPTKAAGVRASPSDIPAKDSAQKQKGLSTSADTDAEKPTPGSVLVPASREDSVAEKLATIPDPRWCKPQPTPVGKWSYLTPYVDGEYSVYPERTGRAEDDDASEDQSPEDKDSNRDSNDVDGAMDDNDDGVATELPTLALNTPTRGSPVPEAIELAALNSPMPGGEEPEDADSSESLDAMDRKKHWRYRKLRDPEEYITAIEDFENMKTADLFDILQAVNLSLHGWQDEWSALGKVVDDFENASRRRIADSKYETRTRNLHQHGVNHEEPEFATRGYKAKEKETMSETRYLQGQDRIMAAAYGFEYDPHPSKIGRQNPETQQAGVTTRGRSLRNQPRQTAKATEADGVTGKRQRKPVQLFDPAPQEASRASTPVPTRGFRRRKNANADEEEQPQPSVASSFNEPASDTEITGTGRRKRIPRGKAAVPRIVEDNAFSNATQDESARPIGRRGRNRAAQREENDEEPATSSRIANAEPQSEPKPPKRHLLVLKIPKGKNLSEPSSAITDNGDSRPSTASSDSTTQTAESSYSFRPKRQKRFRDEPDELEATSQPPPKKRSRRTGPAEDGEDEVMTGVEHGSQSVAQNNASTRKGIKIKAARPTPAQTSAPPSRMGTPASQGNEGPDDQPKEYRAMTKSEKMSASMKNRWANGNMAGAVEKRKATLAAKKAAQAAAEQRVGPIAPKPKTKPSKKEAAPLPGENPAFMHAHAPPPHHFQPQLQPHQPHPHAHQGPPHPHAHPHQHPHQHQHQHQPHQHPPLQHHHHHPPHPHQHQHQHQHPHPRHPVHRHRDYPGVGAPFPSS